MENENFHVELDRMFRYSLTRFYSMGPKQLLEAKEKVKAKTMEICNIDGKSYEELFKDLQAENNWGEIQAMAYFETSIMFE